MQRFAVYIAFVALAVGLLRAGGASAADGNPCGSSSFSSASASEHAVWRMEVSEDEADYNGPSLHDRLANKWTSDAKNHYRWTSATMPVDTGTSTKMMTVSALVIAESVPRLKHGDIVDVYVVSGIDYSKGRAPIVVRRACSARDEGCLNLLPFIIGGQCNANMKEGSSARE